MRGGGPGPGGPGGGSLRDRVGRRHLVLFASVYALQGVVFAYVVNFNLLYMKAAGLDEGTSNDVQTFAIILPFALKFLFGPLSDRVDLLGMGHRRPFIALGIALQCLGLVGLAMIDPGAHVLAFASVALVTVLGLAMYDTCCDGMVLDETPEADRPRVQSVLMVSRFLAATVLTFAFGRILERTGIGPGRSEGLLIGCALLGLPPLAMALILRERRTVRTGDRFEWRALSVLVRPGGLALIAFGLLYAMPGWGVETNLPLFYHATGFDESEVGALGSARLCGRAVGAVLLPLATPMLGRRGVIVCGLVGLAGSTTAHALVGAGDLASATALGFLFGVANGWNDVLFATLAMGASDPRLAASTFALFMAVTNLNILGGSLFARGLVALGGSYPPLFLAAGLISVPALLLAGPLGRLAPRELDSNSDPSAKDRPDDGDGMA
ncbi:MFS transporter [Tautonia plasticadhaerens]|uniref:Major Facilitator Superfamily protein n=1 Tax=Tautonia plasticadhaerens TaxID=2527974 RepID=A0A518GW89_9BACT|nr:MFS transporter [Tautonia plasticadhaerens]QDV32857.1 Major Facilitator Superfamily protein [Tautonia plasticadhaerens]